MLILEERKTARVRHAGKGREGKGREGKGTPFGINSDAKIYRAVQTDSGNTCMALFTVMGPDCNIHAVRTQSLGTGTSHLGFERLVCRFCLLLGCADLCLVGFKACGNLADAPAPLLHGWAQGLHSKSTAALGQQRP